MKPDTIKKHNPECEIDKIKYIIFSYLILIQKKRGNNNGENRK